MLAEHHSYRRAAEALGIGQPALTRSIQALESQIGVTLFHRNPRGVTLTRSGERLAAHAARVLAVADRMTDEITLLKNPDLGEVRLGASPFTALDIVPEILEGVLRTYPKLRIKVLSGIGPMLERMLERGEIDFFLSSAQRLAHVDHHEVRTLGAVKVAAFARAEHPLARASAQPMRDWLEYPIASVDMPPPVEAAFTRTFGLEGTEKLPCNIVSDMLSVLRELVLASDTILLAPDAAMRADIESGRIVHLAATDWPQIAARSSMIIPRDRALSDPARLVIELATLHRADRGD